MSASSEREIQRANPRARRRAVVALAAVALLGCIGLLGLDRWLVRLERWVIEDPALTGDRARVVIALAGAIMIGPLLGAASYIWRAGHRIVRAERFPSPDAVVIRDTPVLRGRAARIQGRLAQGLACALAALAVWSLLPLERLADLLDERAHTTLSERAEPRAPELAGAEPVSVVR